MGKKENPHDFGSGRRENVDGTFDCNRRCRHLWPNKGGAIEEEVPYHAYGYAIEEEIGGTPLMGHNEQGDTTMASGNRDSS
ncbi:hypothetical protein DEO72_LG10g2670 [Vigna unguiculata]|uniref:Uncharacterized protein n=1 Tax=Vigna unguiculata TaxID=3917 RepID=A0A4D6NHM4_VIGUN|nr:hypothetical protein DEO72_LG10g2670 [Vigna unguiculata]